MLEIPINCPNCGRTFKKKASALKKGTTVDCPSCRQGFVIENDGFTDAQKSLDKFKRDIGKLFR